ncbi:LPS export ABC transporter permease LptF [Sodalis-like secondary symbiont of Drepanosiphum platanoidis]|uniref:LPS export ABC transporter permease LptF n=1 Tax=Sodalis-like secondary symbiont of Drepanosiphum platanoidis TaxID=2994493 RepID=UPI0034644AF7
MIIIKYLVRETFKNQCIIFSILLVIFFCQKLLKILGSIVDNEIPIHIIFFLLSLNIPEISQLILPFSLLLGILITFNKLYSENEIIIIYACGLGKKIIVYSILILIFFTTILEIINLDLLSPLSNFYQNKILLNYKLNFDINNFIGGRFQSLKNKNSVLFINNIKNNCFKNVFFAQIKNYKKNFPFIIISKNIKICKKSNNIKFLIFYNGKLYKKSSKFKNFYIIYFKKYIIFLDYKKMNKKNNNIKQMNFYNLWNNSNNNIRILTELNWRITLILSILIMGMLVIPVSLKENNSKKIIHNIILIFLYFIFFIIQSSFYSNGIRNKYNPIIKIWIINIIYFLIILIYNIYGVIFFKKNIKNFKKIN